MNGLHLIIKFIYPGSKNLTASFTDNESMQREVLKMMDRSLDQKTAGCAHPHCMQYSKINYVIY